VLAAKIGVIDLDSAFKHIAHVDAIQVRGLELGAVDFISKSINLKIVRARVNTQLTLKCQADLLRRFAYIDGLTGVYNLRYFDERLANEWNRAARNGTVISLLLLDADFLSAITGIMAIRRVMIVCAR
jgi:PleD family two-component response regulator